MSEQKEVEQEFKEDREFKKISNDRYQLTIKVSGAVESKTVVFYTKKQMQETFTDINNKKNILMGNKKQNEEQLKILNVEDNAELRDFRDKIQKIQELDKKIKLEKQNLGILEDVDMLIQQKKEIIRTIPEFGRNK